MRLTLSTALAFALLTSLIPGCNRGNSQQGQDSARGSSGQSPSGAATGQASEGSTDDRNAPARPASK